MAEEVKTANIIKTSLGTTLQASYLVINDGLYDQVVLNEAATNNNTFTGKTFFQSDTEVKGKMKIKNATTDLVVINDSDGYNTISNKTIFNDLNIVNDQSINSLGDKLNIGNVTTLSTLNLNTSATDGMITLSAIKINLAGTVYINNKLLSTGLVTGSFFSQY